MQNCTRFRYPADDQLLICLLFQPDIIVVFTVSIMFGQLQRQSQSALLAKGLSRGDRLALLLPNCLEFAVSFMALNRIGANVVVIPQGGTAEYIKGVLVQLK